MAKLKTKEAAGRNQANKKKGGCVSAPPKADSFIGEMEEEKQGEEEDEVVYVAIAKEVKEGRANFEWVLDNISKNKKIVIVHIHRLPHKIPTALGWLPISQVEEQEVTAFKHFEREKLNKSLDEYIRMSTLANVLNVEKLVVEKDDVGSGLIELIDVHGIRNLVMGAAADRHYTRRMKVPRSKTALSVRQQADPSCKIWFVCKGNLICTRDPRLDASVVERSNTSGQSKAQRSESSPPAQRRGTLTHSSRSASFGPSHDQSMAALPSEGLQRSSTSGSRESSGSDPWDADSRVSDHPLLDGAIGSKGSAKERGSQSPSLQSMHESEEYSPRFQSPDHDLEDAMHQQLQTALSEAENSRHEAYEEFHKRQKAEKDLNEAMRKVRLAESLYAREVKQKKDVEEDLAKEEMELLALKKQRNEVQQELQKAHEKTASLELQIRESDQIVKENKRKLSRAHSHLDSIRQEHEVLRQEREDAMRENEDLREKNKEAAAATGAARGAEEFSEFSILELEQATRNFDEALQIGEGGYGCVFKGFLRHTAVAIKRLNPQGMQGVTEFQREMDVLGKVRHPNLVTLIGACPEAWALVYEFLPNGSLEDRLSRRDGTPPLTWQARTRIAAEICSALTFLHSCTPFGVVHGDLKPANVLLDANLVSKLSDFGICRLLVQSADATTLYHTTRQPRGTFLYMDPELLSTGQITAKSDVYSFGLILLRLLTGRPAFGVSRAVQEALDANRLHEVLDASAGSWPYVQAEKLARLGLRCCEVNRKNRPDAQEAWRSIEPVTKSLSFSRLSSSSSRSAAEEIPRLPTYFICPILKEVMRDPQIAADGFTYEAEAIRGWLDSGSDTSPMTNLKLPHCELIPNHTLRSAIKGWLQQHI